LEAPLNSENQPVNGSMLLEVHVCHYEHPFEIGGVLVIDGRGKDVQTNALNAVFHKCSTHGEVPLHLHHSYTTVYLTMYMYSPCIQFLSCL